MKILFLVLLIAACSPEQELDGIAAQKADCKKFKARFDQVKPGAQNMTINTKVADCKNIGAWD